MQRLAKTSWFTIIVIGFAWSLAWLIAMGIVLWRTLSVHTTNVEASGGLAAIGFDVTPTSALLVFGPPIALMALRAIASRIHPRRS